MENHKKKPNLLQFQWNRIPNKTLTHKQMTNSCEDHMINAKVTKQLTAREIPETRTGWLTTDDGEFRSRSVVHTTN